MNSKVALITGVTGFIGSNLARHLLNKGWLVHAIIRPNSARGLISDIEPDIRLHTYDGSTSSLIEIMSKSNPEIVFHLASLFLVQHQSSDVEGLIKSNILLGTQLLEALKMQNITKFINTGTSWQHYRNRDYNPVCLYAATKEAFEAIIDFYTQITTLKVVTLELFDTYGPNDPRPKLFNLLNKIATKNMTLDMSPGEQLIDLVYIDDVITAFVKAADYIETMPAGLHNRYMISSGNPIKLKDLVKKYEDVVGKKLEINWGGRPYREREVMTPWDKGMLLPGWETRVSLEEGIKRIINNS